MLGITLSAEDSTLSMSMSPDMLGAICTAMGAGLLSLCSDGEDDACGIMCCAGGCNALACSADIGTGWELCAMCWDPALHPKFGTLHVRCK